MATLTRATHRPIRSFDERVRARQATVAVVGLGYVGLPLAVAYAEAGFPVVGVDIDPDKVATVNAGRSPIGEVSDATMAQVVAHGRLRATGTAEALAGADVIFICVPTPCTRNKEPDTTFIRQAAEGIAAHARPDQLVILRSTSYPGTTEELVRPALEQRGWRVGRDLFLAFAPERVDPGRRDYGIRNTPVLVGGCDPESTRRARLVLSQVTDRVVSMSSPAAAEMAKLLENVFRNVNIALVNQLAVLCDRMGLNIWEIVDAAATKPYGFLAFRPGPGVGGHCIPVDPYYLAWKAREYDFHMDFIELAARINDDMPYYVANKLILALNGARPGRRRRVLVLGVTFKRDVDDYRDSPALKVIELLTKAGVQVDYYDPYVAVLPLNGRTLRRRPLTPQLLRAVDCVAILTDHSTVDYARVVRHARRVFDARNATAHVRRERDKIITL
ncbi:MAG: nucleotide sugar dehydrogenase [Armatimonadota bacterium]|nr:nucleotide sugar dehydrogenase [Armatimonadota bacterium]MDR7448489.1 nucleotide sugar dehydrogenase [Armatimonadota bacterium]MDR7459110.1 nucleotide sugar dehydrogenase [Armatimonadota bacterium]MDR7479426.1 nucleotide sugar dehydrogenase [Armatimonadota bacterium]MDR7487468.1 nucleotide sugar dehydrogenase [Armatimonadota bacterium]